MIEYETWSTCYQHAHHFKMLHLLHPGRCAISYDIYGFSCIGVVNQVHRTEKIQSQIDKEGTRDTFRHRSALYFINIKQDLIDRVSITITLSERVTAFLNFE